MIIILTVIAIVLGLSYSTANFFLVKHQPEGTEEMIEIAEAIRGGSMTFLKYEYEVLFLTCALLVLGLGIFISVPSAIAFLIGNVMSGIAGLIGMKIATYANVRVANIARISNQIGDTLRTALKGGSVMGLCVSGFGLLGLTICILFFGYQLNDVQSVTNWAGICFEPFSMTISCYALGCSTIAIFNRIGGGIYTKAADMGADLVGKTEAKIPEDDPRNPATIADNVGDNVGDVAGLGSDLLESYVGAIGSAIILAVHLFMSYNAQMHNSVSKEIFQRMYLYPIAFAALGLLSCVIGLALVINADLKNNPHKELNKVTFASAALTSILTLILTICIFKSNQFVDFKLGILSPWLSALAGIVSGIVIGAIAEYYTSYDFNPTKQIARFSKQGPAITITSGLATGMKSCMGSLMVIGVALLFANHCSGIYGVAMAAVGMLSFVATTVSVDTYGPIADNAGGIAEMSGLPENVREITDKLDSVGNTTAAIGKGFAIGSASFAALSLMVSYIYSFTDIKEELTLNVMSSFVLVGLLIGGALPFYFSGLLTESVAEVAQTMVEEVRRQFKESPEILKGTKKPDYNSCIGISTKGALAKMKKPALIAILTPVLGGFIFGELFVAGLLLGATLSAIMLAIFCGNAGGAWDNAKKYIEANGIEGEEKGSEAHKATVVGDTVGDPLKDTVGPSLDILIKIMSTVSLITVSIFSQYNLVKFISNMF